MSFVGIEAGGTKFVCGIGDGSGNLSHIRVFKTTSPELTLSEVAKYIHSIKLENELKAIGIGCFGPIDLNKKSSFYGTIKNTPKQSWRNINIVQALECLTSLPVAIDTDVNVAGLGEYIYGNAKGSKQFIYMTVGTGIGCGVITNGSSLKGKAHPEMGHILIPKIENDSFQGSCQYHLNCLEGLASGTAMKERWQVESAIDLPKNHLAWELEANYLALACANYTYSLSPEKIILGGGILQHETLISAIQKKLSILLNQYIEAPELLHAMHSGNAGIMGAIALAKHEFERMNQKINQTGKVYPKPWGNYQTITMQDKFQVKILTIEPNGQLSLQEHEKRNEHWVVVKGNPTLTVGSIRKAYQVSDTLFIPKGNKHRIENFTDEVVKIVEVQVGDYLGEDDIIRYEDIYGRELETTTS